MRILELRRYENTEIFERNFFKDFEDLLKKYNNKITHRIEEIGKGVRVTIFEDKPEEVEILKTEGTP